MNRADVRVGLAILATAVCTSIFTKMVAAPWSSSPSTSTLELHIAELEAKVATLEVRLEAKTVAEPVITPNPPAPSVEHPERTATDPLAPPDPCDEVSCVLNNYEPQCCAKFRRPNSANPAGIPDSLDRTMISEGIAAVRAAVVRCGDATTVKGKVKISVRVGPNGGVTSAGVRESPDPALGACVVHAVSQAHFAATVNGGSFSYPFVF